MMNVYIVTREPFHDNSTLLGAYPSINAAERSVSPSPDKWSRSVDPGDDVVSRYLPDEGEDDYEVHELVVIDDEVMAMVDGKTMATAPDERTLVLLFSETRFVCVTHHDTREIASEFARGLSSVDRRRPDGPSNYRGYLMPDEDARMRAEESSTEVARALYTARSHAARQRPPIRIARASPGGAVLGVKLKRDYQGKVKTMKFSDIRLMDIGNTIQMVGTVYTDSNGKGYYFPFPSADGEGNGLTYVEMTLDDWKALLRQADLVETEVLAQHKDGALYKAVVRKSQRQVDSQVQWNVYRRDNFMCRYCGTEKLPLTVDHLVRWEDGGPTIEENLLAVCRKCNKVRGDIAYAAWLRHPYYVEVSKRVSYAYQELNRSVADTLVNIPRNPVVKDR